MNLLLITVNISVGNEAATDHSRQPLVYEVQGMHPHYATTYHEPAPSLYYINLT